jgi:hypothetical protein
MKDIGDTYLSDIELNHHVQRQILNQFLHRNLASYSDLLVEGLSGNSFLYHLKALTRQKLITKNGASYELTSLGQLVLDGLSYETSRFRIRPTSGVFLCARTQAGEYMLYRSDRQPFIGKAGFVFGKSRVGQDFSAMIQRVASRREITHYTNLRSAPISIMYEREGSVVSHRTGLFVMVDVATSLDDRVTPAGTTFWSKIKDVSDGLQELELCNHTFDGSFIERTYSL